MQLHDFSNFGQGHGDASVRRAVILFVLFAVACGPAGNGSKAVEGSSDADGSPTEHPFCSNPITVAGTGVWGNFNRCDQQMAIWFEARSAVFEGGPSAHVMITTPKCAALGERVAFEFPRAFFRLTEEQQVAEAEAIIRVQFNRLEPSCSDQNSIDALLDDKTRTAIRDLADFWHWSDQRIELENRRISMAS